MSAIADQILTHLEQRAFNEDVRLDRVDEFIASELRVPVGGLYAHLLSDAPAAQRERVRRRSHQASEAKQERARVAAWCRRTLANDAAAEHLRDLAEAMQRLVDRSRARDLAEAGVPDDECVRRGRRQYQTSRRAAGDHDYRYPARYLGPSAANQPVPDECYAPDVVPDVSRSQSRRLPHARSHVGLER